MKLRVVVSLAAVVVGVSLLLGACSSDHDGMNMGSSESTSADAPAIPSDAAFNAADVAFAQEMIPHHAQAIDMADIALERTESAEIRQLATEIKAAQDPEIEQMSAWLTEWGQPVPDLNASMTMGDMGGMTSGTMMTEAEMTNLGNASGAAFDQMFLEMMIAHHEGAIDMAEQELADGKYPPAKDLAQQIINAQTAEIAQMNALLGASAS